MSSIKVMSENLANKIAAGEVIEKCASIVKELVENSIDAKANIIKVNLEDGGLKSITVTDNGCGMDESDAKLSFVRHATSKLYRADDLFFINTLGFRGEALPSIASVSEITMKTSQGDKGILIHLKGGNIIDEENSDANKGTSIKVENIFYNTPARLKYLKSESTELSNCTNYIERLALSNPQIAFELTNNERIIIKTSGSNNLAKVIHELYGLTISSRMIKISSSTDDFDISGFICKPEVLKSTKNHIITFVNGRCVRNNDINKAINDGYYTYKPDNKYPVVVLNISTDPTLVDVNIHPTKQDIKISKISELSELIRSTIKDALYKTLLVPNINLESKNEADEYIINNNFINTNAKEDLLTKNVIEDFSKVEEKKDEQITIDFNIIEVSEEQKNEKIKKIYLEVCGNALGTYIVAQNDEGMFLIDQHAAQERINYEKYLDALKNQEINTIQMLFPITIELSPSEYITIKENINILTDLGFNVDEFGINTLIFKSNPTWLLEGYEEESIRKIIELIINNGKDFDRVKFNEKIAITLACKMSIKGNTHISIDAMQSLIDQLVLTDNPYNCPHGRPTIVKFTTYDLEKLFKRAID